MGCPPKPNVQLTAFNRSEQTILDGFGLDYIAFAFMSPAHRLRCSAGLRAATGCGTGRVLLERNTKFSRRAAAGTSGFGCNSAVTVTQTLVELLAQLIHVRVLPPIWKARR